MDGFVQRQLRGICPRGISRELAVAADRIQVVGEREMIAFGDFAYFVFAVAKKAAQQIEGDWPSLPVLVPPQSNVTVLPLCQTSTARPSKESGKQTTREPNWARERGVSTWALNLPLGLEYICELCQLDNSVPDQPSSFRQGQTPDIKLIEFGLDSSGLLRMTMLGSGAWATASTMSSSYGNGREVRRVHLGGFRGRMLPAPCLE